MTDARIYLRDTGIFSVSRARPTYVIPCYPQFREPEFYPPSNVKIFLENLTFRWKKFRWSELLDFKTGIQSRTISGGIFANDNLICYMHISQLRNSSENNCLPLNHLVEMSEQDSYETYSHAFATRHMLQTYRKRDFLLPHEETTEVFELYVSQEYKSKKIWVEPLNFLLESLAPSGNPVHVCLLRAMPLEEMWRSWDLNGSYPDEDESYSFARECQLSARRRNAMQRLCRRELGFIPLMPLRDTWMARV